MSWAAEVAEARAEVLAEFDSASRSLVEDVDVIAMEIASDAWGRYFWMERRIEVYLPTFEAMPDPENRHVQLRDVVRHELEHALGEMQPGHFESDLIVPPDPWLGPGELQLERDGLTITLPGRS